MIVHTLPVNDLIEHVEDNCLCGPTVEPAGSGFIIIHHSLDGREKHE